MKAPELTPNAEKIDKLIKRIDSGDIRIPAFQRSYVWKQEQVIELLDSIILNYPIGSVLLWHTKERLKHTRNIAGYKIPDTTIEYPVNYVLDGQQRLSSIYAVFSDKTVQDKSTSKYNPNLNIFEIFYDFSSREFLPLEEVDTTSRSVMSLKNLIDTTKLIPALQNLDTKYHNDASELCSKFLNYEIPVVTIKYRTKEEVGVIFERINNTGTKLSMVDLMTAWTWTDDFHLLEATNDLTAELDDKSFGNIPYRLILQAISGCIQHDTTTKSVLELSGEVVRDNWKKFTESIKKAVDFLSTDLNCRHSDFMPFMQQLVPITVFYYLDGNISADQYSALKRWFWRTSFSNRYNSGRTTQKMNTDITTIKSIRLGDYSPVQAYNYTITDDELIETKFSKGSPVSRAFLLLMAQYTPLDLVKNSKVDLGKSLANFNRKEYHHVFPKAYLTEKGISANKVNSTINFCFLPADSNKKISKKKPSEYFFNLVDQNNFKSILKSNLLPIDQSVYTKNDFDKFLEKRAHFILEMIEEKVN